MEVRLVPYSYTNKVTEMPVDHRGCTCKSIHSRCSLSLSVGKRSWLPLRCIMDCLHRDRADSLQVNMIKTDFSLTSHKCEMPKRPHLLQQLLRWSFPSFKLQAAPERARPRGQGTSWTGHRLWCSSLHSKNGQNKISAKLHSSQNPQTIHHCLTDTSGVSYRQYDS